MFLTPSKKTLDRILLFHLITRPQHHIHSHAEQRIDIDKNLYFDGYGHVDKGFNIIKTCYGAKFNSSDIFFAVPQSCGPLNHQQLIQMLPFLISSRESDGYQTKILLHK